MRLSPKNDKEFQQWVCDDPENDLMAFCTYIYIYTYAHIYIRPTSLSGKKKKSRNWEENLVGTQKEMETRDWDADLSQKHYRHTGNSQRRSKYTLKKQLSEHAQNEYSHINVQSTLLIL